MPDGHQVRIGGRIADDGVGGSLRGLSLDDADDGGSSHVAALGGTSALGRHDDGVLMTRRLRWRFASLLWAASVLRRMHGSNWFRRVRHHRATMSGSLACKQRSAEHADDRKDHQNRDELSNAHHAITNTL